MTFTKTFPFFRFGNPILDKYKECLKLSEKRNSEQFVTICELQAKARAAAFEILRLTNLIKKCEKWKIILEDGQKEPKMGKDK